MTQQVKVKVRAGEALCFPAICVHCTNPASERLQLRKRQGRFTREIEVPLCTDCKQEVQRFSGEEERWQQLAWLFGGLILLIALVIFIFFLPGWLSFGLRSFLALLLASGAAAAVIVFTRHHSLQHARPEKQAILNAARLDAFSWRAATFEFRNHSFAKQFSELNGPNLLNGKNS